VNQMNQTTNSSRGTQIRLLAALLAVAAGVTAAINAILVIHTVVG
jgi:hypothetical protein